MIGLVLGLFLFLGVFALAYYLALNGKPLLDSFLMGKAQQGCWELKRVEVNVYRFNSCTGEALPIEPAQPASSAAGR
jgi:hypothetical protein